MQHRHAQWFTLGTLLCTACGGGGGGGGGPTGLFLDSAVEGLDYISGTLVGTTGPDGRFRYLSGQSVLFSIGDVILGVASAEAVVTPVDLIPGAADETDEAVINVARFLQTMDLDLDPGNGILVDSVVRQAAVGQTLDFTQSVAAFEASAQATVDLLTAGLPGGSRSLIPAQDAQAHLGRTLRSLVAGRYDGRFAGDDTGSFSVFVDRAGALFGWAISEFEGPIALEGSADTAGGFLAGNASTGATFSGLIEADGTLGGTWQLLPDQGTFEGMRTVDLAQDLDEDLIELLAGTYVGTVSTNLGTDALEADLDGDGNFSLPPPDDHVSGTIVSTSGTRAMLAGLTDEGCEFEGTVELSGALSGQLQNDQSGERGTFSATRQ